MKYFRLLVLCFISIALILLSSCSSDGELDTPTDVWVDYETLTLKWNNVNGAKIYTVRIEADKGSAKDVNVSKNYYSLTELSEGKYTITVKAKDNNGKTADSNFSSPLKFTREKENGLVFKLINGNTEYEVSNKGTATGVIEIPDTYRNKPVSAIGSKAFFNKNDITEIRLPDSIKSIGDFAFSNCSYLEKINIPTKLESLGESAFSGCRILSGSITLPNTLKEIPKGAFAYCAKVTDVTFGQSVKSIGENAFTDCSGLKLITLPESLENLGRFAFAACTGITDVTFNPNLSVIDDFAFSKAISLTDVSLPNSLKIIGKGAFYNCTSLADIELGNGIEIIDHSAFLDTALFKNSATNEIYVGNWFICLRDDTALDVEFKDGTIGIANNALFTNKSITAIFLPDSVERIGSLAFAGSNVISAVIGSGVKYIADQAFSSCTQLTTVVLGSIDYNMVGAAIAESSLESIGDYAFMNCSMLERIEIPDTVKEIGSYAFRNTEIFNSSPMGVVYADNWLVDYNGTIPEDITVYPTTVGIARYAFYNCREIKSIKIPNTVKIIGRGAFYNCIALETVSLPDSLRRIEDYTFYSCASLKPINLPPMLEEIGRSAFYRCGTTDNSPTDTDNDTLTLPSGVKYIGDFAFYGCGFREANGINGETRTSGIDIILMGDRIEYVGRCAFYGFASLKKVVIDGASKIGEKAFYNCPSLEDIAVNGALTNIGSKAFYKCASLESVKLPDTLKNIGDYAFFGCESLTEFIGNTGLESIGKHAFSGNISLKAVILPTTLKGIGDQAFRDCDALISLYIADSVEYIGDHAFYSCDKLTVYAKLSEAHTGWSKNWNSSFVPVIFSSELSDGGEYVVCVTIQNNSIINKFSDTVLSDPYRHGHSFLGWSTDISSNKSEYSTADLLKLSPETKVYSVWTKD